MALERPAADMPAGGERVSRSMVRATWSLAVFTLCLLVVTGLYTFYSIRNYGIQTEVLSYEASRGSPLHVEQVKLGFPDKSGEGQLHVMVRNRTTLAFSLEWIFVSCDLRTERGQKKRGVQLVRRRVSEKDRRLLPKSLRELPLWKDFSEGLAMEGIASRKRVDNCRLVLYATSQNNIFYEIRSVFAETDSL